MYVSAPNADENWRWERVAPLLPVVRRDGAGSPAARPGSLRFVIV